MPGTDDTKRGTAEPLCYRLPEAGRLLGGVSRRTVHDLIVAGELEVTMVGRRRMVTRESLEALIKRNKVRSAA